MTSENNKKSKKLKKMKKVEASNQINQKKIKKKLLKKNLKESEEKLLRSLAEIENQRRRFEKEIKDAFEFGSYNFAKESLCNFRQPSKSKGSN